MRVLSDWSRKIFFFPSLWLRTRCRHPKALFSRVWTGNAGNTQRTSHNPDKTHILQGPIRNQNRAGARPETIETVPGIRNHSGSTATRVHWDSHVLVMPEQMFLWTASCSGWTYWRWWEWQDTPWKKRKKHASKDRMNIRCHFPQWKQDFLLSSLCTDLYHHCIPHLLGTTGTC